MEEILGKGIGWTRRKTTVVCEGACLGEDECNEAVIRIESDYVRVAESTRSKLDALHVQLEVGANSPLVTVPRVTDLRLDLVTVFMQ